MLHRVKADRTALDGGAHASRVAAAVIRSRARGRFFNLVDLVNQLEQEKATGRSGRLAETLLRYDVIVIDELGYLPFSQPADSCCSI
jgi:DNA replication protein DnaC